MDEDDSGAGMPGPAIPTLTPQLMGMPMRKTCAFVRSEKDCDIEAGKPVGE